MLISFLTILFVNFIILQVNNVEANNNNNIPIIITEKPPLIHSISEDEFNDFVPLKYDENENFDWRLLKTVLSKEPYNTVISPSSIKLLLTLLLEAAGAGTPTQKELQSILPNLRSAPALREYYKRILYSLTEPSNEYNIKIATKMFIDNYIDIRQRYAAIVESYYYTEIEKLNLLKKDEAAQIINNWCLNATNGHIKDFIKPDQLDNVVMLLVNAIYFQGKWRTPFLPRDTNDEPFFITPTTQIRAQFMTLKNTTFFYFNSRVHNSKFLRMPYSGGKFSMTIVLPHAKSGLEHLINEFNGDSFKRIQWQLYETPVDVSIPKFKFEYTANLKEALKTLGIEEIFGETASLPGLARGAALGNNLKVSDVLQRARIIVDESGTTAAAASAVTLDDRFGSNTEEFKANRPFAFFIEDETTGAILFAGKVTDPTK